MEADALTALEEAAGGDEAVLAALHSAYRKARADQLKSDVRSGASASRQQVQGGGTASNKVE